LSALGQLPEDARAAALELKSGLDALHRRGLHTIVDRLKGDGEGKRLLFALLDEPEVHALLAMHGLIRPSVAERVRSVLARIEPYLAGERVSAALISVQPQGAEVELRAEGAGASPGALEHEVEEAILREVPEVGCVLVRWERPEPRLVPLSSLLEARPAAVWHAGPPCSEISPGSPYAFAVEGRPLLLVRMRDEVYAFENRCPHQGLPLDRAMIDVEARSITCPWHGYNFDCKTGECLTAPEAQLRMLPVRTAEGRVEVRLL
jgi:nitrite reductase/ring-hydroxylating ferredoxin subunit/Fe-S cluster biogenesis protein NfuA